MLSYMRKRTLGLLAVLFGVTIMSFLLIRIAPGDPAEMIAIARYGQENINEEIIAKIRVIEGLDTPIFYQYGKWLVDILKGDLGISLVTGDPVFNEIMIRIPATLKLAFTSLLLSIIIGIPAGILSAKKHNSFVDRIITTDAMIFESIPGFWLGLLLIILFSVNLGWLPSFGIGGVKHIILPTLSLSLGMIAATTRYTRASMLDVLNKEYITTAKAKGLTTPQIICNHALKNAMIPIVTIIGLQFSHLIEGTVIIESIFAWPGIGKLLVDSIFARDYAMVQGCVLLFAILVVIINLLVDIMYFFLNPKIQVRKE